MNYPETTIEQFKKYIIDFDSDISEIKEIEKKINQWVTRGVDLQGAINPLQTQIQNWEQKMDQLSQNLKNNIQNLKNVDDRIQSSHNLDLAQVDSVTNNIDKWEYLFSQYRLVLENLKQDTQTLYEVEEKIQNYNKLGVELGDAVQKIQEQNQNIINAIHNSMEELKTLIEDVRQEAEKINDNVTKPVNTSPYWAFYDRINVDGESIAMYLNQSYWNSEVDGLEIQNHTQLNYLSHRSPIYNASVGDTQVHCQPEKPIQYIYYGYEKDKLIKLKVRDSSFGSYYVDSGNCMIQLYFGSSQVMENGIRTRTYFDQIYQERNQEDYQNGAKTPNSWYLIASCEEIDDISQVQFRGE